MGETDHRVVRGRQDLRRIPFGRNSIHLSSGRHSSFSHQVHRVPVSASASWSFSVQSSSPLLESHDDSSSRVASPIEWSIRSSREKISDARALPSKGSIRICDKPSTRIGGSAPLKTIGTTGIPLLIARVSSLSSQVYVEYRGVIKLINATESSIAMATSRESA